VLVAEASDFMSVLQLSFPFPNQGPYVIPLARVSASNDSVGYPGAAAYTLTVIKGVIMTSTIRLEISFFILPLLQL